MHSPSAPLAEFQARHAELLAQLDSTLAVCATSDDVAWALAEFAGRTLQLEDCVVYLADADGLEQRAALGAKRGAGRVVRNRIRLRFGQGIVGTCALTGAANLIPDTRLDPRYVVDDAPRLSELSIPIRDEHHVYGVIDTEHADADHYDSHHIRALLDMGKRAARRLAALRSAR